MGALGLKEETSATSNENLVSLEVLSKLTGFPVDYIKRELFLDESGSELSVEELRQKVLSYLEANF